MGWIGASPPGATATDKQKQLTLNDEELVRTIRETRRLRAKAEIDEGEE
jgi:hypothetical protein